MSDALLYELKVIMQRDVNNRGLGTVPENNLLTACQEDFAAACHSLATTTPLNVGIITGFWIPSAGAAETDGPLGALFLARVLHELGAEVILMAEDWCADALRVGLKEVGLEEEIAVGFPHTQGKRPPFPESEKYIPYVGAKGPVRLPLPPAGMLPPESARKTTGKSASVLYMPGYNHLTHLIAIERAGPSHTQESFLAQARPRPAPVETFARVPAEHYDQCHTMRGQIIAEQMVPVSQLFEAIRNQAVTIGIGDGGNEIGMGKIPWEVIATNVPNGAITACRVATDYNLVCGVSNWGAYALGAGVWHLTGKSLPVHLFNVERERIIGEKIISSVKLVDGVTGQRTLSVDGLPWDVYSQPIAEMFSLVAAG